MLKVAYDIPTPVESIGTLGRGGRPAPQRADRGSILGNRPEAWKANEILWKTATVPQLRNAAPAPPSAQEAPWKAVSPLCP